MHANDWDPIRAELGPAATPAASKGRTRDRTRPMLQSVHRAFASPFYYVGLAGDRLLPDGLRGSSQLHRSGVSSLSQSAQGDVTTIGTFNYFAGDDPTGTVFLAASWK